MQPTIEEARRRILEADERGEIGSFDDVILLMHEDRLLSQCTLVMMEATITYAQNKPRPEGPEEERLTSPDRARNAVLRALDTGEGLAPALATWMRVDRAAGALFRFLFQTMSAPDDVLHLGPIGLVAAA